MLIKAANNQEIHDLSSRVVSKVDTSKVLIEFKENKLYRRKFNYPAFFSSILSLSLIVIMMVFGISNKSSNNNSIDNSDGNILELPVESVLVNEYVSDVYMMSNIALSSFNVDGVNATSSYLTSEEELEIIDTLKVYIEDIYNIIYDIKVDYTCDVLDEYNCVKMISNGITMNFYYKEQLLSEKNLGTTYRSKSSLEGYISYEELGLVYMIDGTKEIKNGAVKTVIDVYDEDNVKVRLERTTSDTKNIYEYSVNGDTIRLTVKEDEEEGKYVYYEYNDEDITFRKSDYYILYGKVKSHNSEELYVSYVNNIWRFLFKNSNNKY